MWKTKEKKETKVLHDWFFPTVWITIRAWSQEEAEEIMNKKI